jgi:hypothetical protein
MSRSKRILEIVPVLDDTPDARGFIRFAAEYYEKCLILADDIVLRYLQNSDYTEETFTTLQTAVFDKIAPPAIYLYQYWEIMNPEKKVKYDEELKKIHEEGKKLAEKLL